MSPSDLGNTLPTKPRKPAVIVAGAAVAVLVLIALDSTVVTVGSDQDVRQQAFAPDSYGNSEFPRIQEAVKERALDASLLLSALTDDKKAATETHATMAGAFPVFPVKFEGVVGEGASGIFNVAVEGLPKGTRVRVQTGPAINGTELRDITGDIEFGAFKNQIEYQDAGAGINRAMSSAVLADLNRDALAGKTVSVVGVFKLINPKNWLVTPVDLVVK